MRRVASASIVDARDLSSTRGGRDRTIWAGIFGSLVCRMPWQAAGVRVLVIESWNGESRNGYPMTWRSGIKGHPFDLELLVQQFDRGRACVIRDGDDFWLESPSFDGLPDAPAVQTAARMLLGEMNDAAKLADGSYRAVELQDRFSDGTGVHVVLLAATAEARSRAGVATVVVRDAQGHVVPPAPPTPTKAPVYLDAADRDPAVREVLQFLADDHPDWFALYKVMEIVETDAGGLGAFSTKTEVSAFGASANHPDVSGVAARHAPCGALRMVRRATRRSSSRQFRMAAAHAICGIMRSFVVGLQWQPHPYEEDQNPASQLTPPRP